MTYLEIAKLGELLLAIVEFADKWFGTLVDDSMSSHIAPLSK